MYFRKTAKRTNLDEWPFSFSASHYHPIFSKQDKVCVISLY